MNTAATGRTLQAHGTPVTDVYFPSSMALRDERERLSLIARRHDERLREVGQALEAARDG